MSGLWGLNKQLVEWLQSGDHLFYVFHHYGPGAAEAVQAAANVSKAWKMPALMTEFGSGSCDAKVPAEANGIGWSFWECEAATALRRMIGPCAIDLTSAYGAYSCCLSTSPVASSSRVHIHNLGTRVLSLQMGTIATRTLPLRVTSTRPLRRASRVRATLARASRASTATPTQT